MLKPSWHGKQNQGHAPTNIHWYLWGACTTPHYATPQCVISHKTPMQSQASLLHKRGWCGSDSWCFQLLYKGNELRYKWSHILHCHGWDAKAQLQGEAYACLCKLPCQSTAAQIVHVVFTFAKQGGNVVQVGLQCGWSVMMSDADMHLRKHIPQNTPLYQCYRLWLARWCPKCQYTSQSQATDWGIA